MSSIGEIRLHIKILSDPERFSVDDMINEMKSIYKNAANIEVRELSREFLNLPLLQDIDVGRCVKGETTEEQEELFRNRSDNIETTDVVVYFVRSTIPPLNGCAAHSVGKPSCVVTKYSSRFTVAHEVGHVLNLNHVFNSDRLMYGQGTDNITNAPPDLIVTEVDTIKNSEYFKAIWGDENIMVSLDEVKKALNVDEPDYGEIANRFGQQALPHLQEIAKSDDILLASKAVYLSGEISGSDLSVDIMNEASKNDKPEIRIAAIAGLDTLLKKMTDPQSINITSINDMLNSLKNDQDPGVNKLVNRVLNSSGDKLSSAGDSKSPPP